MRNTIILYITAVGDYMDDKRFIIIKRMDSISIIDTEEENGELLALMFEDNEEMGNYLEYELDQILCILNEQNRLLKENNIYFP